MKHAAAFGRAYRCPISSRDKKEKKDMSRNLKILIFISLAVADIFADDLRKLQERTALTFPFFISFPFCPASWRTSDWASQFQILTSKCSIWAIGCKT